LNKIENGYRLNNRNVSDSMARIIKAFSSPILSYDQVWQLENGFSSISKSYFESKLRFCLKIVKLKSSLAIESF